MSDNLVVRNSMKLLEKYGQTRVGIENVGHTSYLSATLQALFACEEFRVNVVLKSRENPDLIIYKLLSDIFVDMMSGEKQNVTPQQFSELMCAYRETHSEVNEEYDPKLFLTELLHNLQQSVTSAASVGEGLLYPTDVFFCQYQIRWQCSNRHICSKQQNVWINTLSFPEGIYRAVTVQKLLHFYMRGDNSEAIACERCVSSGGFQSFWSSSMSMQRHFSKLPNILLLELPLFQQNVSLWKPRLTIDDTVIVDNEKYSFHACVCSDLANPQNEVFVCYAKLWGKWYYFNDKLVAEVFKPSQNHLNYAYILFYLKLSSDYRYEYYERIDAIIKSIHFSPKPKPKPSDHKTPSPNPPKPKPSTTPPLPASNLMEARRVGFVNQGRTCYMNSALQCLYHCTQFRRYVISSSHYGVFHELLKSLFTDMTQSDQSVIDPKKFWRKFQTDYPQFTSREEHDSQEFCTALIAQLNGEINAGNVSANFETCRTPIDAWTTYVSSFRRTELVNLFGFLFAETKTCPTQHLWYNYTPAWILVVQVPQVSDHLDIQRILELSVVPDIVDVRCGQCGDIEVKALFVSSVSRPPNILVIQLGIFTFDMTTYRPKKICLKITVNEEIRVSGERYSCAAMVCHSGSSIEFGHYYAFAKCGTDWYQFNDSNVRLESRGSIPNADVLCGVYVLFYEKIVHNKSKYVMHS